MTTPPNASRKAVLRVLVDGKDLTDRIAPRLSTLRIREKRGEAADELEITLDDSAGDLAIPPKGAVITVQLGFEGEALVGKGAFKVDETRHDGPPDVLTITARSADFTADLRTRREQSWRDTTLGAVLAAVAGRQGLTLRCAPDLAARALPVIAQSRESDTQFLARLGRRFDAVATIKSGALIFAARGAGVTASGAPLPAAAIARSDGDRYSWKSAARDSAYTGCSASWHSIGAARRRSVRAGAAGKVKHLRRVYGSEAAAREAANAEMGRIGRGGGSFSLSLAVGRPDLYPERRVNLTGFKAEINATAWLIDEVTHDYGAGGLTTEISCEVG